METNLCFGLSRLCEMGQGPGPKFCFLMRGGFRDCEATPDPEPLTVGFLGTGVCCPCPLNYHPPCLLRESMASVTHQTGLPCHAFTSFLLWLSSAPESRRSPSVTTCSHHAAQPGSDVKETLPIHQNLSCHPSGGLTN